MGQLICVPFAVGIAFAWKGELLGWLASLGLLAFVFVIFYGRLFNNVLDTITWAQSAVDTLEALVGHLPKDETE